MKGLEFFAAHFKGFEDCYTLIGGAAAELLSGEAGLAFRATKDLDIVVLLENPNIVVFTEALKEFVTNGGYEPQVGRDGEKRLYRFVKPTETSYPAMLEIFSWLELPVMEDINRAVHLPADIVATSLSALLLDRAYYELLLQSGRIVEGVHVLDIDALILFKMKAWLDLSERYKAGDSSIDSRNIKKHFNDILRLQRLLDPNKTKVLDPSIRQDVVRFLDRADVAEATLKNLKINAEWNEILSELKRYYL